MPGHRKTLEPEQKLKKLIAEANAPAQPDQGGQELGAVLWNLLEPDGQTRLDGGPPTQPAGSWPQSLGAENPPKPGDAEAADTVYLKVLERVRQKEQEREDLVFKRFLQRLFGQIASANSTGLSRPHDLYLPSPPPLYRLRFDRSGAGRFERSPLGARVAELYELLSGLDLSRLRRCSGCEERKLFWATRVDQIGCGKVCSNRIRVRNFNHREQQAAADPVPAPEQTVLCSLSLEEHAEQESKFYCSPSRLQFYADNLFISAKVDSRTEDLPDKPLPKDGGPALKD